MSAVYTIIILALFALGMPVAFVLLLGGVLGMLFFLGGLRVHADPGHCL